MDDLHNKRIDIIHPHAQAVARSKRLPTRQLAFLDDPDDIDEVARLLVRRRTRARQRRLKLYWSLFYGGTSLLLGLGLLLGVTLIALAVLWLTVLVAIGLVVLRPEA